MTDLIPHTKNATAAPMHGAAVAFYNIVCYFFFGVLGAYLAG